MLNRSSGNPFIFKQPSRDICAPEDSDTEKKRIVVVLSKRMNVIAEVVFLVILESQLTAVAIVCAHRVHENRSQKLYIFIIQSKTKWNRTHCVNFIRKQTRQTDKKKRQKQCKLFGVALKPEADAVRCIYTVLSCNNVSLGIQFTGKNNHRKKRTLRKFMYRTYYSTTAAASFFPPFGAGMEKYNALFSQF